MIIIKHDITAEEIIH